MGLQANIAEVPISAQLATVLSPFSELAVQQPGEPWPVPSSPSDSSAEAGSAGASSAAHDSAVAFGAAFRAAERAEASLYGPPATALAPDPVAVPGSAAAAINGPADAPHREETDPGRFAQPVGISTANGWQDTVQVGNRLLAEAFLTSALWD